MAERSNISELFRRTMQTNIGFYAGLVDLSANYLKDLSAIFNEVPEAEPAKEQPTQPHTGNTALVLEAEAGETAQAYFLVDNQLTRKVPAEIIASPVVDANGQEVAQQIQFEPSKIELEPGERILVQVTAVIDQTLEPGAGYRGSITVPGLSDTPAAIVIRRLHSVEESDVAAQPIPKTSKRSAASSKRAKAASAKK